MADAWPVGVSLFRGRGLNFVILFVVDVSGRIQCLD